MKASAHGADTSRAEVQGATKFGVWIRVGDREFFLAHGDFPWFKNARLSAIYHLELLHGSHLHWPELDVDLELDSLEHTERYPLLARRS